MDVGGDFHRHLAFDAGHDFVMGVFGGHAGDLFEFDDDLVDLLV